MLAEELAKAWDACKHLALAEPAMRFTDEGLVLGAGTVLTPVHGAPTDIRVDPRDSRLTLLLTAAHLAAPTATQLAHLAKAADRRRGGEDALAAMHLALSGLSRLARPRADAHRLFLADSLLKAGVRASAVLAAIEPLARFDPDQPRVPAGSGRPSGQWTSGDAATAGGASSDQDGALPATTSAPTNAATGASGSDARPQPEVNPNTVTETAGRQYANEYACQVAQLDCIETALEIPYDPPDYANSNLPVEDIRKCREAGAVCVAFSAVTHALPFLDGGGGVIFPHGGMVLITGGMIDRYVPPIGRELVPK